MHEDSPTYQRANSQEPAVAYGGAQMEEEEEFRPEWRT